MASFASAAQTLHRAILAGTYAAGRLPAERLLGEALGVSRPTVRKAIAQLVQDGVLERDEAGKVRIRRQDDQGRRRFAFLAPAYPSASAARWEQGIRTAIGRHDPGHTLSSLRFWGADDPVIIDACRGFDGVFFLPGGEAPSPRLQRHLQAGKGPRLASLDQDYSAVGVPSVFLFQEDAIRLLLDRAWALGHRDFGWLNTQPVCADLRDRQQAWSRWLQERGLTGRVVSRPVLPYQDPMPPAHAAMLACLDGFPQTTMWLCSVSQVARGAYRAIADRGLGIGREVSIAVVDGEMQERYLIPTLACVEAAEPSAMLEACVAWMASPVQAAWQGPLLVRPSGSWLRDGLSLGPITGSPPAATPSKEPS